MQVQDLIGVWIIQSFHLENLTTGERSQPWGEHPSGTVVFHPDGRMFALITPGEDASRGNDQAAAFRNMLAYSGPYRIDPPNRLVTHVDIAWFPSWVGTEQVRTCEVKGDNLTLTSAPLLMPQARGEDAPVFAVVTWRREKALSAHG